MYSCGRQTHVWQSKRSCNWWDSATLKVLVLPCSCLHQELLTTCLPQHQEWDTGRARTLPTTRRAQPSEPLRHAAMLSLQKRGTARKQASKQAEDVLSHQESGTPRGTMTKLPITNAVTSRQVQLDRSMYTCKKACWRIALALCTSVFKLACSEY